MGGTIARTGLLALLVAATFFYALARPERSARACGVAGPYDFDAYEADDYVTIYNRAIELAAEGKAVTFNFRVSSGDPVDVTYQGLKSGARSARQPENQALRIPPSVFKSIAWVESNWSNAAGNVPYGGVGPALRSFDCGYGMGQVTSGMFNSTGTPTARQALIGTHPLFNLAEGARILADKWNSAPKFRPIAGTGDPAALEDWYFAVWSYNGFAFSNHPLHPNRNALRGSLYHCYDPTAPSYQVSGGVVVFNYGDYTYPERVYGCLRYPPAKSATATATVAAVSAQATTAPTGEKFQPGDTAVITGTGDCLFIRPQPGIGEIACLPDGTELKVLGGPVEAAGRLWWNVQTPQGQVGWAADEYLQPKSQTGPPPAPPPDDAPAEFIPDVNPANRIWPPQKFFVPVLSDGRVASAFAPGNFLDCEDDGFSGGCPAMDFPTTIAERKVVTHPDTTPPADETFRTFLLGDPKFQYSGPAQVALTAANDGSATSATVVVKNVGKGIAPFRVRTSAPWIVVRHPTDPASRTLDGGVAVGTEIDVVIQKLPRVTQKGYDSTLVVTLAPDLMPGGSLQGKVWIEPLLGSGGVFELTVTAAQGANSYPYRAVAPGVASGE